jgi:hypothetical protein
MKDETSIRVLIAEMGGDVKNIKDTVSRLESSIKEIKTSDVTVHEFKIIRGMVFGGASLILVGFVGAIVEFFIGSK